MTLRVISELYYNHYYSLLIYACILPTVFRHIILTYCCVTKGEIGWAIVAVMQVFETCLREVDGYYTLKY